MTNFPRGKFSNDDEGALAIGIAVQDKTIIINFFKPVEWIGLDVITAEALIQNLQGKVNQIRGVKS